MVLTKEINQPIIVIYQQKQKGERDIEETKRKENMDKKKCSR